MTGGMHRCRWAAACSPPACWPWLLVLVSLLAGCASPPQTRALLASPPAELPSVHRISRVPFIAQDIYQCGPASLAMLLGYNGAAITAADLAPQVYTPGKRGSLQLELIAATRRNGQLPVVLRPELADLLRSLHGNQPVLVFQNLGLDWYPQWHYALVTGFDLEAGELVMHSGAIADYRVPLAVFERTWARGERWAMVAVKPGDIPAAGEPGRYFLAAADFERFADSDAAARVWAAGARRWPESAEIGMGYGNHLYQQRRMEAAAEAYRAVILRHPLYAPAWNNLAQVRIDTGARQEAIELATRAVALDGDNPLFRQTLAEAQALP